MIAHGIKNIANKYPPAAPEQSGVSGVGGWLLLLVTGLMFLVPLMRAVNINTDFMIVEDQYPNLESVAALGIYKSATCGTFLLVCYLSFYAGLGLFKERSLSAVKRSKITLWVIGPIASFILRIFIPVMIFGKSEPGPQFVGNMIDSIFAAAIWTAYLSTSKRVKATYGITTPST